MNEGGKSDPNSFPDIVLPMGFVFRAVTLGEAEKIQKAGFRFTLAKDGKSAYIIE